MDPDVKVAVLGKNASLRIKRGTGQGKPVCSALSLRTVMDLCTIDSEGDFVPDWYNINMVSDI